MNGFDSVDPLDPTQAIAVSSGDRIPGIPEHLYKATIGVDLWQKVSFGIDGIYSGDQYFRGDEANTTGKLSGYWLFNATVEYKVNKYFALFGKVIISSIQTITLLVFTGMHPKYWVPNSMMADLYHPVHREAAGLGCA